MLGLGIPGSRFDQTMLWEGAGVMGGLRPQSRRESVKSGGSGSGSRGQVLGGFFGSAEPAEFTHFLLALVRPLKWVHCMTTGFRGALGFAKVLKFLSFTLQ